MNEQKMFVINETERNALLVYLQEKPFKEVAQGVQMLSQLPEIPVEKVAEALMPKKPAAPKKASKKPALVK